METKKVTRKSTGTWAFFVIYELDLEGHCEEEGNGVLAMKPGTASDQGEMRQVV